MKPHNVDMPPPPDEPPPDDQPGLSRRVAPMQDVTDRAESALLGALLNGADVAAAAETIRDDVHAWGRSAHRAVWDAILDVHADGVGVDTVAVAQRLSRAGRLDEVGGAVALADLAAVAPARSTVQVWAEEVAEGAQRRRAYLAAHRLLRDVQDPGADPWQSMRAALDDDVAPTRTVPELRPLGEFLAEPDPEVTFRIEGLWPAYGNALLAAAYKAGKSTTVGNALRSLADGVPLYGRYEVNRPRGKVALIDDELHESTLRRWLRDQGIVNVDAVHVVALKGQVGRFDPFSDRGRAAWAAELRCNDVSVLVVDCLRPILDAHGMDENSEMGQLLLALETLAHEAGIDELLCVHHMGHAGERSRGDSRLRDWPDVEWKLVRQSEDSRSPRYFSAYGRDVDEGEQLLRLEPDGRRLTIVGGSRRDQTVSDLIDVVLEVVADDPGVGARGIRDQVRELAGEATNADIDKARNRAIEKGLIELRREGTKHAHHPTVPSVPDRAEDVPAHPPAERAAVPIGGTARTGTHDGADQRAVPDPGTVCTNCNRNPQIANPPPKYVGLCFACAEAATPDEAAS